MRLRPSRLRASKRCGNGRAVVDGGSRRCDRDAAGADSRHSSRVRWQDSGGVHRPATASGTHSTRTPETGDANRSPCLQCPRLGRRLCRVRRHIKTNNGSVDLGGCKSVELSRPVENAARDSGGGAISVASSWPGFFRRSIYPENRRIQR
jgi:hypothetical protein